MKKEKQPSAAKTARKSIHERLVKELKTIAAQLQKQGVQTIIDIEKEAKKLAKKITKGAKESHPLAAEPVKEKPATTAAKAPVKEKPVAATAKTPVKENTPPKQKPATNVPQAKVKKAAVPAVTPEPPVSKPVTVKAAVKPKAEKK